ncbi:MAG: hypothetical protein IID14_06815 [Candidatus Marinimicrobia bacterium]|nr:hypothetical protein [Candidatus Neomarinimicrobiota bacterium]
MAEERITLYDPLDTVFGMDIGLTPQPTIDHKDPLNGTVKITLGDTVNNKGTIMYMTPNAIRDWAEIMIAAANHIDHNNTTIMYTGELKQ